MPQIISIDGQMNLLDLKNSEFCQIGLSLYNPSNLFELLICVSPFKEYFYFIFCLYKTVSVLPIRMWPQFLNL